MKISRGVVDRMEEQEILQKQEIKQTELKRYSKEEYLADPFFQDFLEILKYPRAPDYSQKFKLSKYITNKTEHPTIFTERMVAYFANNIIELYKLMKYPRALRIWLAYKNGNNVFNIAKKTEISRSNVSHWTNKFLMLELLKPSQQFLDGNEVLFRKNIDYKQEHSRMNVIIGLLDYIALGKIKQHILDQVKSENEKTLGFLEE